METNGGTHFNTENNKEAIEGKSDETEEGGKEEVKEEKGISAEGGKIETGISREGGKEEVKEETGVSPARWWVLTIFSLLGMLQCMLWNTWGPVKTLLF